MERIEPIANVLNHCINYHIKVVPIPSNIKTKPWYLRTDPFSSSFGPWIYNLVRTNDTFVIAKSLRYPPMSKLENYFVREGKDCYHTDGFLDPSLSSDRITFTTLSTLTPKDTRNTVVVFTSEMNEQELFRACSRALRHLYIIDDARKDTIPMLINDAYLYNANTRASGCFEDKKKPRSEVLTRKYRVINPKDSQHTIIPLRKTHNQFVADITGLAIPMIYEYRTKGSIAVVDLIKSSHKYELAHKRFLHFADFDKTSDILKLANIYLSICNGYRSKLSIEEYDWLSDDLIDILMDRMSNWISNEAKYEVEIGDHHVDCVDKNIIWELKCKSRITNQDINQLSRYAEVDGNVRVYRLFNILTNEIIELV